MTALARATAPTIAPIIMIALLAAASRPQPASAQDPSASGRSNVAKAVGTIKSVAAGSITVAAESGDEITAKLSASTKILRVPPGEKDLKNATTLQPQDVQIGDRVLVRGSASSGARSDLPSDARTIDAVSVIIMKQADVAAKHQQQRDDWQKRGVAGLVTKVDASADLVTISSGPLGAAKNVEIEVAPATVLRRYAPGSVNFDDAKPAPLNEIKVGDQLRSRGARSADGKTFTAEEVVSGSFRNIAGVITLIDTSSNTLTVQDAISKSPVVVTMTSDSQIKKLPAEMAQRIAMRLKAEAAGEAAHPSTGAPPGQSQAQNAGWRNGGAIGAPATATGLGAAGSPASGAGPGGGPPDMQRILSRLPGSKLSDLQKGDAVMIVSTQGGNSGAATAITLLAGVEPILTAAPKNSAASLLSPWSLNAGGEGESAQ